MPTLNFDDIALGEGAEQRLANGYAGFNWLQAGIYNPNGALPGYAATSGANVLFIAEAAGNEVAGYEDAAAGSALVLTRADAFSLQSFNLSSTFQSALTVTIRAYADEAGGHLIGQKTVTVGLAEQASISLLGGLDFGTFLGAHRVEFNANDGNPGTADYFGIDNLSFVDTPRTVLDFEDFSLAPGGETPLTNYRGFAFLETGIYRPDGALQGYTTSSGNTIAFIAEANGNEVAGYENVSAGSPVVITNANEFTFLGGNFSAAFRDGLVVTIRGYADAAGTQLVHEAQITARQGSADLFSFLNGEFAGLHRLEFSGNDGNPATSDYFGFDDLSFFVADAGPVGPGSPTQLGGFAELLPPADLSAQLIAIV